MIVVTVEMWPGGRESEKRRLGRMTITNDGTGDETLGNYNYAVMGKQSLVGAGFGHVSRWRKKDSHVWKLVRRVLAQVYP